MSHKLNEFVPETPTGRIFASRRAELEKSKAVWRNWFLADVALLIAALLLVSLALAEPLGFTAMLWLELVLTAPLGYAAIFCHAQYSREREFMEEYAFKAMVAESLESYLVALKRDPDFDRVDEQKKILTFALDGIKGLHTPPRAIISKYPIKDLEEIKVGVAEKLAEVVKKFIPSKP